MFGWVFFFCPTKDETMTVAQLITKLKKMDPNATVWISDQQGGGGKANPPYVLDDPFEFYSGEIAEEDDIVLSFENT
jgi:hypothetical protein